MISPPLATELRAILKEEFGVDASEAEAAEIGAAWVGYFEILHTLNQNNQLITNEDDGAPRANN